MLVSILNIEFVKVSFTEEDAWMTLTLPSIGKVWLVVNWDLTGADFEKMLNQEETRETKIKFFNESHWDIQSTSFKLYDTLSKPNEKLYFSRGSETYAF